MSFFVPIQGQSSVETFGDWRILHGSVPYFDNFSVHHHEEYEFFLHVRNGTYYQLGQRVFPLQDYHLLVMQPGQPHGLVSPHPLRDFERLLVQVSAELLEHMQFDGTNARAIIDRCCGQTSAPLLLAPQDYLRLQKLAASIPTDSDNLSPLERMEALGYLSVMLSLFCQACTNARRLEHHLTQDSLMQDVYNHLLERFSEDCSLDALAERFNISKFHLSHRFSETYGISLHQFVLRCRVAYAQLLIRQGEPMVSAYYQCGFSDYSAFVRAFSRIVGISPRAWRRQQQSTPTPPSPPFLV